MRKSNITRDEAFALLCKYNKEPFHIQHALTVEGVMRWYAEKLGYGDETDYWGIVGLLHDIDFELYPDEHCKKAPELLAAGGVGEDMIHAVCSHGYGICCDVGEGPFCCGRAYRTYLVGGAHAPVEKRNGYGSVKSQKEIQRQKICRWMLARRDTDGRGASRMGA